MKISETMLHRVYSFIGVDADYLPAKEMSQRPRASVNSLLRLRVIRFANRRRHNFTPDGLSYRIKPNLSTLDKLLSNIAYGLDNKILRNVSRKKNYTLSTSTIQSLQAYFDSQIDELEELLGQDLSAWRAP